MDFINKLNELVIDNWYPDLTFVLNIPFEIGLLRATARRGIDAIDVFESKNFAYHKALNKAYLELSTQRHCRLVHTEIVHPATTALRIGNIVRDSFGI